MFDLIKEAIGAEMRLSGLSLHLPHGGAGHGGREGSTASDIHSGSLENALLVL
jgi:hypothetical protein